MCMCIQKNAFTYLKLFSLFAADQGHVFGFFLQHEPVFDKRITHWEEKCGFFDLGVWVFAVVVVGLSPPFTSRLSSSFVLLSTLHYHSFPLCASASVQFSHGHL